MRYIISFILLTSFVLVNGQFASAQDEGIGIWVDMLPWDEVDGIIPKYSKFTILDVETGKRFNVQRRAGSGHADVQPLTSKDTKIMKDIYNGKWSWKRRAIIVIHNDQWIAASMHGMPHGAGKLDNNFKGHFCVHFNGSKTHRKKSVDLSHQLMILKSAGKLNEYLNSAEPELLIQAYIAGIKQKDRRIVSTISVQKMNWEKQFQKVENIKPLQITTRPYGKDELYLDIPIEVEWIDDHSKRHIFNGKIHLMRFSPTDGWKVDSKRFVKEIFIGKEQAI
ncbi:hypothetical protein ACFFF5_02645 [Lederbergia wuyishanensis]|uniref:Uncharacterized protein n=1 Tax=Lederbergia wuyishanensis TaxID=1347903 RepID=A0ABU0D0G4_9BACI|nr:hypothetical protein [Lederbergia wuyishanensis]MCJ8006520.1 hypothetical protein [Lederbergia wuyishanensis]MDQ0341897.1 hypothetical protein [Lederbergia wuyishanensis]